MRSSPTLSIRDFGVQRGPHRPHGDLVALRSQLANAYSSIINYEPVGVRLPILDSGLDTQTDALDANDWVSGRAIPGMRALRDAMKRDLDVLEKFLADPESAHLPPLSTNAPFLIAVWREVLCSPPPVVSVFDTFSLAGPGPERRKKARTAAASRGVKVDVVADNGRQWIRVNTVKNSRLLAEFREMDSYFTDDDDSDDPNSERHRGGYEQNVPGANNAAVDSPTPIPSAQAISFDNSILSMGRDLLVAAKQNPVSGTEAPPRVSMRLTRLEPSPPGEDGRNDNYDPRIAKTIECLSDMGVDVHLGEREDVGLPDIKTNVPSTHPSAFRPTANINLDLSVLIALVSDLTHAPLPTSENDAMRRFVPPRSYVEWKQERANMIAKASATARVREEGIEIDGRESPDARGDVELIMEDLGKHSAQLIRQVLQEMRKGILVELRDKLQPLSFSSTPSSSEAPAPASVTFWTTQEAHDRCVKIVAKIGGPNEQRRVEALFASSPHSIEEQESAFWEGSRYPHAFVPLIPVRVYPSEELEVPARAAEYSSSAFFDSLAQTCRDILALEVVPHPRALPTDVVEGRDQIQRASVMKANPKLTTHTVQSMLLGATMQWTTLTANKSSVKALLREINARTGRNTGDAGTGRMGNVHVILDSEKRDQEDVQIDVPGMAAIWVVDPRSLSEGMRGDLEN